MFVSGAHPVVQDDAQAASLISEFFSLFKKKPKPTPIIIVPNTDRSRGRLPQGRRILNRYVPDSPLSNIDNARARPAGAGRRTMCVRLCDGFYWPMRSGGTNNSLMRDSQRCASSCKSASRLFVLHTSTDNIAQMRDLGGRRYGKLKNAFKYRKSFNPSCRCKPAPWSERARLRHRRYAAVGKERRDLAIRSITLDLRKTFRPKAVSAVLKPETGPERFWDPDLPVRNPVFVALRPDPVMLSRRVSVQTVYGAGRLMPTSSVDEAGDVAIARSQSSGVRGMRSFSAGGSYPMSHVPRTVAAQSLRSEAISFVMSLRQGFDRGPAVAGLRSRLN